MAEQSGTQQAVTRHAQVDMARIPGAAQDAIPDAPAAPAARKIGEGHFMGMMRLGAHELTQALPAFPDSNVRALEEPGVFGNATPQIVTDQMGYHMNDQITPDTPRYDPESYTRSSSREPDRGRGR